MWVQRPDLDGPVLIRFPTRELPVGLRLQLAPPCFGHHSLGSFHSTQTTIMYLYGRVQIYLSLWVGIARHAPLQFCTGLHYHFESGLSWWIPNLWQEREQELSQTWNLHFWALEVKEKESRPAPCNTSFHCPQYWPCLKQNVRVLLNLAHHQPIQHSGHPGAPGEARQRGPNHWEVAQRNNHLQHLILWGTISNYSG